MKALVLAAGEGTRMRPLTEDTPKPLLPVGGKPIIRHAVDELRDEVDEVIVVAGYMYDRFQDEFGDDQHVRLARQREQRGTAHAALRAREYIEGPTVVLNGDDIYTGLESMLGEQPMVLASEVDRPESYGVLTVDSGRVKDLTEKPSDPDSKLVNTGCFTVDPRFFELLEEVEESERGELEITDALSRYIDEKDVKVVKDDGWQPCSYPWQLLEANTMLLSRIERKVEGRVAGSATIRGEVVVEEGARVGEHSIVEGPAVVKSGAEVGPGSLIRPHTVLHSGVEITNSEVKNSVLRQGSKVPHFSYVGDSYLGRKVNLGAGAKAANLRNDGKNVSMEVKGELMDTGRRKMGFVAGSEASIGVNCSVKPGRKIGQGASVDAGEKVEHNVPSGATLKDGEIHEGGD